MDKKNEAKSPPGGLNASTINVIFLSCHTLGVCNPFSFRLKIMPDQIILNKPDFYPTVM